MSIVTPYTIEERLGSVVRFTKVENGNLDVGKSYSRTVPLYRNALGRDIDICSFSLNHLLGSKGLPAPASHPRNIITATCGTFCRSHFCLLLPFYIGAC